MWMRCGVQSECRKCQTKHAKNPVTADILAPQVLLNRVPEQVTEDSVKYQIYY